MRRQPLGTLENNQLYFIRKDRRMEGIKINKLEIENVKRIKAVKNRTDSKWADYCRRQQQSG